MVLTAKIHFFLNPWTRSSFHIECKTNSPKTLLTLTKKSLLRMIQLSVSSVLVVFIAWAYGKNVIYYIYRCKPELENLRNRDIQDV